MDKTFYSKSFEVNESLNYPELASIDSKFLKKINRFVFYTDFEWTEVFLITHSDDVYAFGSNIGGKLGFGHKEKVTEPTIIPELCGKKVIDIKCGYDFCVALTQTGQIYTFGCSSDGMTGNGNKNINQKPLELSVDNQIITTVDCTDSSTHVLTQTGEVYWFGYLYRNQNKAYTPTVVVFPSEVKIKSISCGWDHILALTVDGKVFSWGSNYYGQLALGHNFYRINPQMIELNEMIKQISCGYEHSLLLTTDRKLYSMGSNEYGQLGIGNKKSQNIPQLVFVKQKDICCYCHISMSLDINNKLYIWGNINEEKVVSPVLSEMTSFQEVINTYSKHRSTLRPIELLKPINSVIKTTTKMFNNPKNCDFKFIAKSKVNSKLKDFNCHKCFIRETTDYFQVMFDNNWSESGTNEILITDYSYEAYSQYSQYIKSLYTDIIDCQNIEILLEILSITEQYLDSDGKDKCVEVIKEKTNIENVCSVYSSAIKFNSDNLREYALKIMKENIRDLVKTTDYKNMDPIYAKQFFTEYHIKNEVSK